MRSVCAVRSLLAVASVAVMLAACGRGGGADRAPEPGDAAVARVEGQTIWASDVKREAVVQGVVAEKEPLPADSALFRRVLDDLVDQKLLAREAVRRKLDQSPLAQRRLAAARDRTLGDILVQNAVDDAIDEKAVKALYDDQLKLAQRSQEIKARLILVKSQADADAVSKLLSTGASFEALAMERSTDAATRFNGGDLGYFAADATPPAYAAALKDAKPGQVVGPFATDGGYALLKVEDRRQEQPLSLDQARPQILRFLTYDEVRQLLQKLRGQAKVQVLVKTEAPPPGADGGPLQPPASASPVVPAGAPAASTAPPTAPAAAKAKP